jgi:hypothetical protein
MRFLLYNTTEVNMGTQGPGKRFSESPDGETLYADTKDGRVAVARQLTRGETAVVHAISGFIGACAAVWYLLSLMSDPHVFNAKTLAVMSWQELGPAERLLVFVHEAAAAGIVGTLVYFVVFVVVLGIFSVRCINFRQASQSFKQ